MVTAVIIAHNEAAMIGACLATLTWCEEVIVVDDGSSDETVTIAEDYGARVMSFKHRSFARKREAALKQVKTDWVLYIDADERIVPTLAKEIMVAIETNSADVLGLMRSNVYFGKKLQYGGWGDEQVIRCFKLSVLDKWTGAIHESPVYSGTLQTLKTPLVHFTHRDVVGGLRKTASWTPLEAEALYKSPDTPQVTFRTLVRKGIMEFVRRAVFKRGYKDGMVGLIEATIQAINRVLVYMQVWELQQKPSIPQRYERMEAEIKQLWQQ